MAVFAKLEREQSRAGSSNTTFFSRHFESESLERANERARRGKRKEGGGGVDGCSKAALYTPAEYLPLAAEISRRDLISVERGEEIEDS